MYLLTRPIKQSIILQNDLMKLGIDSFIEPIIKIKKNKFKPIAIQDDDLLLITSFNALEIFATQYSIKSLKIAMVGYKSSLFAKSLGFNNIIKVTNNIFELIFFIKSEIPNNTKIIYPRSEHISFDVKNLLYQYDLNELLLYKSVPSKKLSDKLVDMIRNQKISRILFFSKRTVDIFIKLANNKEMIKYLSFIEVLVMSNNIARQLEQINWKKIIIAKNPTKSSMLELCR